ncbi:hypothetical protein [Gordonia sihwensis]|uniref:hypothetical protein n=1 Tax=Gordonia sihwensis TaxID=173559 RepID=UPI003D95ED3E
MTMNNAEDSAYKGEDTDHGRWVTDQVAVAIANDGEFLDGERVAFRARDFAESGDLAALAAFVTNRIKTGTDFRALRAELSANDYDRINWCTVASELTTV